KDAFSDYIFMNGKWMEDKDYIIQDHLVGYDSSEPDDSPYDIGNSSVVIEMKEISKEEAFEAMNNQILSLLKEQWKNKFKKEKEIWDKNPKWPAKFVNTTFKLNGIKCTICPLDIGLSMDNWDQGFMESIQGVIEEDLKQYGAEEIISYGSLD
ncbi:MAG: hypothetical protein K6A23_14445, partial [Butyrivibrio sp.]|nr:hypothetical protein [Butyrivibrio sp.]